jgi:beta-N-acetylhexosaminidase
MLDVQGLRLTEEDRQVLSLPSVGGVILFSRNYVSREQLIALVQQMRSCNPDLLIAVDHEGGRVQRFKNGFTRLPAMGAILASTTNMEQAKEHALQLGWLMAYELIACDIDISFAPVLDLNGISQVIGDRSFSAEPDEVILLASAFIDGMHEAGMKCTGKHFPGHGSVLEDSHIALPIDQREFSQIAETDLRVFSQLIREGKLDAIMPAHVIYQKVDAKGAGFSAHWLQDILRQTYQFEGLIFSDDLSMEGAGAQGGYVQRAEQALVAGCDMVLACNNRAGALEVAHGLSFTPQTKIRRMKHASSSTQDPQRCEQVRQLIEEFYG